MKYRYYVSWFCKLNMNDNGLGLRMDGHIEHGVFEINHPLNTKEDVEKFTTYLQSRQENPKMWQIILLAFSLMYITENK